MSGRVGRLIEVHDGVMVRADAVYAVIRVSDHAGYGGSALHMLPDHGETIFVPSPVADVLARLDKGEGWTE